MNKKVSTKTAAGVVYHYYNCNPHRKLTDDCVIRAIATSTGRSWQETMTNLAQYSIETGYMLNTHECYGKYLEDIGYVKQKQPIHQDGSKVKFKEFVKKYHGHAVCHCGEGHLTYVADNSTWDIWDVSNEIVGYYWVHKSETDFVTNMKV